MWGESKMNKSQIVKIAIAKHLVGVLLCNLLFCLNAQIARADAFADAFSDRNASAGATINQPPLEQKKRCHAPSQNSGLLDHDAFSAPAQNEEPVPAPTAHPFLEKLGMLYNSQESDSTAFISDSENGKLIVIRF
jgi:hypothetical protein